MRRVGLRSSCGLLERQVVGREPQRYEERLVLRQPRSASGDEEEARGGERVFLGEKDPS